MKSVKHHIASSKWTNRLSMETWILIKCQRYFISGVRRAYFSEVEQNLARWNFKRIKIEYVETNQHDPSLHWFCYSIIIFSCHWILKFEGSFCNQLGFWFLFSTWIYSILTFHNSVMMFSTNSFMNLNITSFTRM